MPSSSPVFRKLFLSSLALITLTLGALDFYLTRYTGRQLVEALQRQLAGEGGVLRGELGAVPPSELRAWARSAESRALARVTVIDPSGSVLADSQHDPESMENHRARPEVRAAIQGKTGRAVRHSATLNRDLFYVALPLTYQGRAGYAIRLAAPLRLLDTAIAAVRWRIIGISVAAAVIALAMAFWFSRNFTRRVRRLQAFAGNLARAQFSEELKRDADDELGALAASLNDTSRQLRDYIERLSLESGRREAILAGMVEGVLAVDGEMRVMFCNPAFARAVHAQQPVPDHLPVLELARDPALLDILTRTLVTGKPAAERMRLVDAGGRTYEVHAAPLLRSPSKKSVLAVFHDVTELERLERIRRDFVANVSHELRTPLAAISGYAETLLDGALEDEQNSRRFVEIIKAQATRLNNIASDLLTLSQLESGVADPPAEPVSIAGALDAAARTVAAEAGARGVALSWGQVDEAFVMGHKLRLEQAFVNLLDNAVKFNHAGGEVRIEARRLNGTFEVAISDTGIGIPSDDQPRIFERFYRVDKARSRAAGGTGLGLSIVKHVVERMNGSVGVESELGKGSKFTVVLPIAADPLA